MKFLLNYLFKNPAETQFLMGFLIIVNPGAWQETSVLFFNGWFGIGLVVASLWAGIAPTILKRMGICES